jgi:hypothetical protein
VYETISIEEMNKPAVALVNEGFVNDARSAASSKGWPGLRIVSESVPPECNLLDKIDTCISKAMEDIISALTRPLTQEEKSPKPREKETLSRIVFKGDLDEVNRFFYKRGWTDGLPIVPPTEEAVEEMLQGTDLPRDHLVAEIFPRLGKATVEKIAVNAVMAGALPTYMPVLITAIEALMDPDSRFGVFEVSTGSWAPFYILNGPIRHDLNMNSGQGALSPGDIANAAIGRAMGLIVKNIGGARKGIEDMGVMGNPGKYTLVIAENEEASHLEPLHVEQGFHKDDSTITVSFPNSYYQFMPYGTDDQGLLRSVVYNMLPGIRACWLIINPTHTEFMSKWTKKSMSEFIWGHALTPVHRKPQFYGNYPDQPQPPGIFLDAGDHIPILSDPGSMRIIVAGGAGMFMGLLYGGTGDKGPVTKRISLPSGWDNLVKKYKDMVPAYVRY